MDVRNTKGAWNYFYASVKWSVKARGVHYSQGKVLVPLLREEVPFGYEDLGDVVFLWDPATSIALASPRVKAQVVSAPVGPGDSAVALFGPPVKDEGYCYRLVTQERTELGAYPTVAQLAAAGARDVDGVSFREVSSGLYHCERVSYGKKLRELPPDAVVGASGLAVTYALMGICVAAYVSAKGPKHIVDAACVMGAAEVDLSAHAHAKPGDGRKARDVHWFAVRELQPGVYLNMGVSDIVNHKGPTEDFHVRMPDGATELFWLQAVGVTCSAVTNTGWVHLPASTVVAGWYVYCVTAIPLPGTAQHSIKYRGFLGVDPQRAGRHCLQQPRVVRFSAQAGRVAFEHGSADARLVEEWAFDDATVAKSLTRGPARRESLEYLCAYMLEHQGEGEYPSLGVQVQGGMILDVLMCDPRN